MFLHAFQCMVSIPRSGGRVLLVLACGPRIYSVDGQNGDLLATRSPSADEPKAAVTKLHATQDGLHLVATTAEDKAILVFLIGDDCKLQPLSRRCMPKRPCAIAFTPAEKQILVGDKFGDVYALPLVYDPAAKTNGTTRAAPKPYKPAANNFTVHTERNLKSLQMQMNIKNQPSKTLEAADFEHELILGHVSMLTDMISVTRHESSPNARDEPDVARRRSYILTSDRDEHIRVSRGLPQAHIINNYCFGHTEFISKMCLPSTDILVSAGGDDNIFIWDWPQGDLLGKVNILHAVREFSKDMVVPPTSVAVSGLWVLTSSNSDGSSKGSTIICTSEAVPALFMFSLETELARTDGLRSEVKAIRLPGNPIDGALIGPKVVFSIDNVHEAWSKTAIRKENSLVSRLYSLDINQQTDIIDAISTFDQLDSLDDQIMLDESLEGEMKAFRDLVYNVENLRKRGNDES